MPKLPLQLFLLMLLAVAPQSARAAETPEEIRNRAVVLFAGSADDKTAAIAAFEEAAAAGDAPSMSLLANIYLQGDGVAPDRQAAIYWYYQAALVDQPGALEALADMAAAPDSATTPLTPAISGAALREGGLVLWTDSDTGNDTEAVVYFRMAAEQGDTRALGLLGDAYFSGYGVASDIPAAFGWYEQGASAGDSRSMTTLVSLYRNGNGVDQDLGAAFAYATDAAATGDRLGLRYLGDMYRLGEGTPKSFADARDNLEAAAALGDTASLPLLGALYGTDEGSGAPDPAASFMAYRNAYDAGILTVAAALADDYRRGFGTSKDVATAIAILTDATTRDLGSTAMTTLGDIYVGGEAGSIDTSLAADWYRQASDAGYGPAQTKLADLYRRGAGVARDLDYTRTLLETALSNGEAVQPLLDALPNADQLKAETAFSRATALAAGPLSPKDEAQLRDLYLTAAQKDAVPDAMLLLADMFGAGRGGDKSDKDALAWRLRAADAGSVPAMIAAARDYELGIGAEASRDKALALYLRASAQGSEPATLEFERLTDTPILIAMTDADKASAQQLLATAAPLAASAEPADRAEALKLYAEAAALGDTTAMLAYGERVAFDATAAGKDRQQAFRWLEHAAKTGSVPAMGLIARGYAAGDPAARDLRAATRWFARAADAGDPPSLVRAADFYINGAATPADLPRGAAWLDQALAGKLPGAAFIAARAHLPKGGLPTDAAAAAAFMVDALVEGDSRATAALTREAWPSLPEPFRKALQQLFVERGLYDGVIDGLYGSRTAAAIEQLAAMPTAPQ